MRTLIANLVVAVMAVVALSAARADHRVGDICRIKGQEENILHGMGLVTGLKGTGDTDMKVTQRALAHYMELLGHHLAKSDKGQTAFDELKSIKNVALVYIVATVPPGGAQQGDVLDCYISAPGAKSLDGGYLMLTELFGSTSNLSQSTRPMTCGAWSMRLSCPFYTSCRNSSSSRSISASVPTDTRSPSP